VYPIKLSSDTNSGIMYHVGRENRKMRKLLRII